MPPRELARIWSSWKVVSYTVQHSLTIHVVIAGPFPQPVLGNREAEAQTPADIALPRPSPEGARTGARGCHISQEEQRQL
jgi:hypothetical protein